MRNLHASILTIVLCGLVVPAVPVGLRAGGGDTAPLPGVPAAPPPAVPAIGDPPGDLDVVATAHLDTQWRWTIRTTIDEYIRATLDDNFALLETYPHYVFSFEGAFRYQLMKEYYPERYARLEEYVRQGRWRVCGSWLDAVDVNIPSPESLIRHALYGNGFFRRELGVESRDVYLPDCFGFGYALPTVARHCGIDAFSTQKLTWGSAYGTPFNLGRWRGVDGAEVLAALNPDAYVSDIEGDLSADSTWVARIDETGDASGVYAGLKYFGTGDTGGGPTDGSVAWLEKSLPGVGAGPLRVHPAAPDDLARRLTAAQRADLPVYDGELLMTKHGAGCYTSQAAMKRWNRQNEILADAAERASVVADWLGALEYPGALLEQAWTRFLWHQFHDDLTGTSIPEAYGFSWNDEILSLNQFAQVVTEAVGGVARGLDTQVEGVPVVVFNPLAFEREDVVRVAIDGSGPPPEHARAFGPGGDETLASLSLLRQRGAGNWTAHVSFAARGPATGFSVYDVRWDDVPCPLPSPLSLEWRDDGDCGHPGLLKTGSNGPRSDLVLENERFRVGIRCSDIVSIRDKQRDRELLDAPIALQLLDDEPDVWAAWEIDHADLMAPPRQILTGIDPMTITEWREGPSEAHATWRRACGEGSIAHTVRLASGPAGDHVEIEYDIDWRSPGTLLKLAVPLAVANEHATYDLGVGTIARPTNTEKLYEVPAQRWADLTDASGSHGVAVITDSRHGWDRPGDHTLRLTLVHTPAVNERWRWIDDQKSQDLGRHRVKVAIYPHEGDWRQGVQQVADRVNQPLLAFQAPVHPGALGRSFSFMQLTDGDGNPSPQVAVKALKKPEEPLDPDEFVVRLQELHGERVENVTLSFPRPVRQVRELDGAERWVKERTGRLELTGGKVHLDMEPYRPRTLAIRLRDSVADLGGPAEQPITLPYDRDGFSLDADRCDGDLDGAGHTLPGHPDARRVATAGVAFELGDPAPGRNNVTTCRGQEVALPDGEYDSVYLLAAATGGGRRAAFTIGGATASFWVPDFSERIGQWNNRLVGGDLRHDPDEITPAYINRAPVGYVATHRHSPGGENESYVFSHFFTLRLDRPAGAGTLRLPDDPAVLILAATTATDPNDDVRPAQPLYDRIDRATVEIRASRREFVEPAVVELWSPNPDAAITWKLDDEEFRPYAGMFEVARSAILTARVEAPGLEPCTARAVLSRVAPRPSLGGEVAVHAGLECRYFEGTWERLPDFTKLEPLRRITVLTVGIPESAREEDIGLELIGSLRVPRDGMYRLRLWSDDGSALWIGDEQVIVNDGLHGSTDVWADVALARGLHRIRIAYFQHLGGSDLKLEWEGPQLRRQEVPAEALGHW